MGVVVAMMVVVAVVALAAVGWCGASALARWWVVGGAALSCWRLGSARHPGRGSALGRLPCEQAGTRPSNCKRPRSLRRRRPRTPPAGAAAAGASPGPALPEALQREIENDGFGNLLSQAYMSSQPQGAAGALLAALPVELLPAGLPAGLLASPALAPRARCFS